LTVHRFPDPTKPKADWIFSIDVKCGWGKEWDPPVVPGFAHN